jgi:outer membrane translocation and assembly module TamA
MRGYFYGRYRDKAYMTAQAEYRRHLWWKLGGVVFLGFGQVGPELSAYRLDSFHSSYGFGLRYLFNPEEHVNIRVDFGFGRNDTTTGVYFGVEEAF